MSWRTLRLLASKGMRGWSACRTRYGGGKPS